MPDVDTPRTLFSSRVSRQAVFSVVIAVFVCAMFVGGAFGAEFSVPQDGALEEVVALADSNTEDDIIILTSDITITNTLTLSNGKITIIDDGNARTIYSSDRASFFHVDAGGELVLSGTESGSLTLDGRERWLWSHGGAVYVDGGHFTMNDGVTIQDFGWLGSDFAGVAGVYVNDGTFTMNGGLITGCDGKEGGGVYVASQGSFEMIDGLITKNGHNEQLWGLQPETYGGGVLVEEGGEFIMSPDAEVRDNYGSPDIAGVVINSETGELTEKVSYTVHHSLERSDSSYEMVATQTVVDGTAGNTVVVTPREFPGYKPQQESYELYLNTDVSKNVITIYYDYNPTYLITIPDYLDMSYESPSNTMQITATEMWILETGWVDVTVSSEHNFNLSHTVSPEVLVSYTLAQDGATDTLANGDVVATFSMAEYLTLAQSQTKPSTTLRATVTGHPPLTGEYRDLLTFTASYNEGITT